MMKVRIATAVALVAQLAVVAADAQTPAQAPAATCLQPAEVTQQHLLGLWRAQFDGLGQGATLLLEPHPELRDSVRGAINRHGERAVVAGDVEQGEFTLEESENGINISATWVGDVVAGSCGHEIRGTWQSAAGTAPLGFVLRKIHEAGPKLVVP